MSLAHAQHNEELCYKLHAEGKWNDWVITTAFYSAIHFVEERLFPLKVKETEYKSFDEYYSQRTDGSRSQHEARLKLVSVHLHKAYGSYRWLHDSCRTARYYNYAATPEMANTAVMKLKVAKSLCVSSSTSGLPTSVVSPAKNQG
jgi:hypothetical protein